MLHIVHSKARDDNPYCVSFLQIRYHIFQYIYCSRRKIWEVSRNTVLRNVRANLGLVNAAIAKTEIFDYLKVMLDSRHARKYAV